jgi:hypothetical protein
MESMWSGCWFLWETREVEESMVQLMLGELPKASRLSIS